MESPFDVLGVGPDADDEELIAAYRQRVKETHPDHGGSPSEFQRVQAAYEEIQDGHEGAGGDEGSDAPDVHEDTHVEFLDYQAVADHGWRLDDDDLFEKAAAADLGPTAHGTFTVEPHESLLEAAEHRGYAWPYACRGGACANCAVAVCSGELSIPVDHILTEDLMDRGFRLSCNGVPTTGELQVVFNVKHLPGLDELRLPPYPFEAARADD